MAPFEDTETAFPMAERLLAELDRQMPFLCRATTTATASPVGDRLAELDFIGHRLAEVHGTPDVWMEQAVRSYIMLSLEFLQLQKQLEATGRYLLSSEQEARERVYDNPEVFGGYYLPGVLLSQALWPNHFLIDRAFREDFLPLLDDGVRVVEVGVGTGYHLCHLLRAVPGADYLGLDISAYAIDHCRRFALTDRQPSARIAFAQRSISDGSGLAAESVDAFVLGEILEHVSRPDRVLEDLWRAGRAGAVVFMSTVVFTANIDHIYLFEKVDDIRTLVAGSGWRIAREWPLPVHDGDTPEMARRPMNYAAILKKAEPG